jgi:hypothetical protein
MKSKEPEFNSRFTVKELIKWGAITFTLVVYIYIFLKILFLE